MYYNVGNNKYLNMRTHAVIGRVPVRNFILYIVPVPRYGWYGRVHPGILPCILVLRPYIVVLRP